MSDNSQFLEASRTVALIVSTLVMGLMAGLFFAFSCAVMPGLGRTDDRTFVGAMQWINVRILNGWFAVAFGGALVFTVLAGVLHLSQGQRSALPWIAAAVVLYGAALVITMAVNVPLNNTLDAAGKPDAISDLAAVREHFEAAWVRWNHVRTLLCTAGLGCLAWALVLHGRVE
ncbi:anthrone oxygenase family protein [Streptomyces sp. H27-D2]|uniref:anthrone oxygenase family protein n=1 Tax=Streptomyces sp. H27-D2 TaxID=3046304 RepID=UPI002DBCC779|nr:anthrone oxygenase family protein [Streptomyces sp. H27-D2]MEC4019049.1 anthrone oxygenase family protein [Streptomyces sp. H27-D2]